MANGNPEAGWYKDPSGASGKLRYWDGTQWTQDICDQQPSQQVIPTQAYPINPAPSQAQANSSVVFVPVQSPNPNVQTVNSTNGSGGLAITGFILGLLCIVGCWIPIFNNFVFIVALLGIILALIAIATAKRKNYGRGLAIAGLILSILSVVLVLATQAFYSQVATEFSNNLEESLNTTLGSAQYDQVGDITGESSGYGTITITGSLKNTSGKDFSYASVTFSLYDANEAKLGTASDYINGWKSGETWKFSATGFGDEVAHFSIDKVTAW
jgi:membrane protein implicated in regulation of membrane protease activity